MIIKDITEGKIKKTGVVLPFRKNIFQIKINKSIEIVIVHNPGKKNFHQDNVGIILEENKILKILSKRYTDVSITKIDNKKDIYNLMGKETKNMWELFEIIAKKHNKKIFKIKTKIINKILPKFIKENFFKKNSFLGQFLSIDQSFINEKDITII